ncbi:MAG: deoxyribose-phosphate aldolase [Chloroflexi bacterium RBG_16_57_11]|nr:MAG: deoxyribose-phosphate aldolase [Chloroflexi bacterium RBG_16_57_11]
MTALNSKTITYAQLAKVIDHSLLRPELTEHEVIDGCRLAARYHTATVCVKPCYVRLAVELLKGSDVKVASVVGFPHGSNLTAIKVAEAQAAMDDGAEELDMVLNISQLRSGQSDLVGADIRAVCDAAHARGVKVKVIFENAYLNDEQKIMACHLSEAAGADWIKTSTGFAPSGATLEDLRLMRAHVSDQVQVKAAGGVRTLDALLAVIDAGVTRCGATATAAILDDYERRSQAAIPSATSRTKDLTDSSGDY